MSFPAGKLPADVLRELLQSLTADESIIVGPGVGRDAAAIRFGDRVLVLKSDPITFATEQIGSYLVNVNANDIACMGADPKWLLVTALLPEGETTPEVVHAIFTDLRKACDQIGCLLVGGHTEITEGLERPILIGSLVGTTTEGELIDPSNAEPGDAVLLLSGIAIEGTAILAAEKRDDLASDLPPDAIAHAQAFLTTPGISVVNYARLLRHTLGADVHALHDPTEGGLATALHELAESTGLGIEVQSEQIVTFPETEAIARILKLDPLGLIASGALLAVVPGHRVDEALALEDTLGVPVRNIGRLTSDPGQRTMTVEHQILPLPTFEVDEIARMFAAV